MTPEEIVERVGRVTDPYKSSEPFDSEQTLARLIQACHSMPRRIARTRFDS